MKYKQQLLFYLLGFTTLSLGILANINQSVIAQIIPDSTLGSESSSINHGVVKDIINGGATRGSNLFHSFQEFNVDAGKSVYFATPTGIENILTRVTGGKVSNILGTLGVEGTANLFLINPNGIFFGKGANLDIRGSFTATTANSIKFPDSTEFNTQTSENTPLLTITTPIGLQFGNNPGTIQVQTKNGLQVQPNQTLALVGGDISLEGTTLGTAGGRIELGSVKEAGLVNLTSINQGFLLGFDGVKNFGDIQLSGGTNIDISSITGGEIRVNTRNLRMIEDSRMTSLNLGSVPGGAMIINATDTIEVIGTGEFEKAFAEVINPAANPANRRNGFFAISLGTGSGGNFEMNTGKLSLRNGAFILISAFGQGKGGNVNINASKSVEVIDSLLATGNRAGSTENAGSINLNTGNLILQNRGILTSTALGNGKAGNITINAAESIDMTGGETFTQVVIGGGINTRISADTFGASDAGDLTINTKQLTLSNKAQIGTATFAGGNGGNLTINADFIELIGNIDADIFNTTISASSQPDSTGNAGNLTINTHSLEILNGAIVSASTSGLGNAGNLTVNTHSLQILNGGFITANTSGSGNAGNLTVNASDIQIIGTDSNSGSGLYARSNLRATGAAGNIEVTTNTLELHDGAVITASTFNGKNGNININSNVFTATNGGQVLTTTSGTAQAGNIIMKVKDNITLDGTNTGLFANTQIGSTGDSGSIDIDTAIFIIKNGAGIGVNSQGTGKGGDIKIETATITLDNKAFINAETSSSQGGNIDLNLQDLLLMRNNSKITATAGISNARGNGGNITINSPFIVAVPNENNDITANAYQGNGGNINISTNQIFGLRYRPQETALSDITASSQFGVSGNVEITTPGVDPTYGLTNLPTSLVDAESLNKDVCAIKDDKIAGSNSFIITGKGGLPADTHELISNSPAFVEWENHSDVVSQVHSSPVKVTQNSTNHHQQIQQAQGWIISSNGNIILTADTPKIILQTDKNNLPNCK